MQEPVCDRRRAQLPVDERVGHLIEDAADLADKHRPLRKRELRALLGRQGKRQAEPLSAALVQLLQQTGHKEKTARQLHPVEHAVVRQLRARRWVQPKGKCIEAVLGVQNTFLLRHIIARFRVFLHHSRMRVP